MMIFFVIIAKTTLCLIVITTTCQTDIQFARGGDCCDCCQNTDHSYIMQSSREIIGLFIHLSWRVYNSSFENLESTAQGQIKKCEYSNSKIVFEYANGIQIFEYSNIR